VAILSDILVADRSDAPAIISLGGMHGLPWPRLALKGLDTIKLGTLFQILHHRPVDDDSVAKFMRDALLDQRSAEGPWVFLVPEELTSSLAEVAEARAEGVVEQWAATDEFQLDGWPEADVEQCLQELIAHARQARDSGKSLLLWMSL